MTTKQISELLDGTEHVRKHKGQFKYWRSYFYHHGVTSDMLAAHVKTHIPSAVITGHGDHWHAFVGGAKSGSAQDSHMWVTFTVPPPAPNPNPEPLFGDYMENGDGG